MYKLHEKFIKAPKGITCKYLMPSRTETENLDILIVSVIGVYPQGSLGNAHGHYIATMVMHGLHFFDPDCVILDLRALEYRWGNTLLLVFHMITEYRDAEREENEPFFPVLAVTSEKSEAAFLSLVTPVNSQPPNWHFRDINQAISEAISRAKLWLGD